MGDMPHTTGAESAADLGVRLDDRHLVWRKAPAKPALEHGSAHLAAADEQEIATEFHHCLPNAPAKIGQAGALSPIAANLTPDQRFTNQTG
jgi:hypothetical protein